jgi:hypothetical protein
MNMMIKNKYNSFTALDDYITSITNNCLHDIGSSKKSLKVDNSEKINIPTIHNYQEIMEYNYNVQQLKTFAKFYKIKISGNKKELVTRIFVYLKLSFYIIKIQKIFRGVLQRKFNWYHGPAYQNRKICTNSTDFISMEEIKEIPFEQFFSYEDSDGFVYGFDITSLYHLIFKSNKCMKQLKNPYNRNLIPEMVINNIKSILRLCKVLKTSILLELEDDSNTFSSEKRLELKTLALFQNIDSLGNYSDPIWFLSLNRNQILKFLRELIDIWNFRAQLSIEIKKNICPPSGNPFYNINMHYIQSEPDLINVKKYIVEVLEKLVNHGIDRDSKTLGAYYVLGALTLVNHSAATSIPWLFQSFSIY